MQHMFLPARADFKHHSVIICATTDRRAVKIPGRVADQTAERIAAIRTPRESVKDDLISARIHVVHNSVSVLASLNGRAVEVSGRVAENTGSGWEGSVVGVPEIVEDGLIAGGIELV